VVSPTRKAAAFNTGCDYLPNSAMANEPDENEKKLFPKKRFPTTRTGSVGYPFILQEAITSTSTSSLEHGASASTVSEEAIAAMVQVR
jgi:hypothetical protein